MDDSDKEHPTQDEQAVDEYAETTAEFKKDPKKTETKDNTIDENRQ